MNGQATYSVQFAVTCRAGGTYIGDLQADSLPLLRDKVDQFNQQQEPGASAINYSQVTKQVVLGIHDGPLALIPPVIFNHAQKPVKRPRR